MLKRAPRYSGKSFMCIGIHRRSHRKQDTIERTRTIVRMSQSTYVYAWIWNSFNYGSSPQRASLSRDLVNARVQKPHSQVAAVFVRLQKLPLLPVPLCWASFSFITCNCRGCWVKAIPSPSQPDQPTKVIYWGGWADRGTRKCAKLATRHLILRDSAMAALIAVTVATVY